MSGARRYEVSLFDADGVVLWEHVASDTFALLPDSVQLNAGASYFWRIRALTDFARWAESELTEFTVAVPPDGGR